MVLNLFMYVHIHVHVHTHVHTCCVFAAWYMAIPSIPSDDCASFGVSNFLLFSVPSHSSFSVPEGIRNHTQ